MIFSHRSLRRVLRGIAPLAITAMLSVPLAPLVACSSVESPNAGCTKDDDCKGDRVCSENNCVDAGMTASSGGGAGASTTATTTGAGGASTTGAGGATTTGAGGATTTASTGTGMMCDGGMTSCDGGCVDTNSDVKNCGGCGKVCGSNLSCLGGSCNSQTFGWVSTGVKSVQVMTGSCANNSTTKVTCDATTNGVEARVLDVTGIELKPLMDIKETGAVQGRTAFVSADGLTLSLTGETGCGADKLVTMNATTYVCKPLQAPPSWKAKGTMSAQVVTGSCANNSTTKVTCDASTKGVEARVLDVTGIELKPLMDIKETGAVQGRTASVSADGLTLSLTGETGCGADKLVTTTVTVFVCE